MADEYDNELNGQLDGETCEKTAEKLDKSEVEEVAGGSGKQSYDKPPELPEI